MDSWLHWGAAWWLVIDALATYRMARLVARDEIAKPFRVWLDRNYEGALVTLVSCIWCLSVWFAGLSVLLTRFVSVPWSYLATILALSAVAGVLGQVA